MTGNLEKITKGQEHPGQTCVVCQEVVGLDDEVVLCPRCHSVHHVDCWKRKGGCGKTGCPQVAQAVVGERPEGDGPPPPVSKRKVAAIAVVIIGLILFSIFRPKPPDPAMGRTKIVVFGEAYHELTETMTSLTEDYNATSEEIYIDLQLMPPGAMDTKLVVLIAANEAPDVIALGEERFNFLAEQEALLPLGEDDQGEPIYGIQHPAQLAQLVVYSTTEHPAEAVEILHYFVDHIPPADLDLLRELQAEPMPFLGF